MDRQDGRPPGHPGVRRRVGGYQDLQGRVHWVSADYGLLLLPPVTLSCSHEHSGFAGTVSLSASTLVATVTDVAESLRASGIDRLAIVNGHGGNYVLANVVQQANIAGPRMTLFPSRTDWEAARTAGWRPVPGVNVQRA
jgi:creatinine amidohydrolase/Fe(II)-dependent formamide hydrolase-like protein